MERLTASILRKMEDENVSTYEVGAGGNEIDVASEFTQPGLKGTNKPCDLKTRLFSFTMEKSVT